MQRRAAYEVLAAGTLGVAAVAGVLAAAGAALQSALGAGAAGLCAALFAVPGIYFLVYSRRLRSRDAALAHAAAFARSRGTLGIGELADELRVSPHDAEKILRKAVEEGHLFGRFEGRNGFVADPGLGPEPEGSA